MMLSAKERERVIALASRSHASSAVVCLRAGGQALQAPDTDALLARAVARERVEVELEILAYEQGKPDPDGEGSIQNRRHVRIRDGAMMRFGRSGRGVPFIRDHRQDDSLARSGTVIESRTDKLADGHYQVWQTVKLSEPAAVERALRGLMSGISVGWHRTGPLLCTVCGIEVLSRAGAKICTHAPGDVADDGTVAEWEYQDAELVETSEVPIPAVQSAGIEGIRAALAALAPMSGESPQETPIMNLATIATTIGLAATASGEEVGAAVTAALTERDALRQQLAAANTRAAELNARLETHEAALALQAEDAWISEGLAAGKVTRGPHEQAMRAYFKSDSKGARALLETAPRVSPVGLPSQLGAAPDKPAPTSARLAFESSGIDYDGAKRAARMFGAADPEKALARLVEA